MINLPWTTRLSVDFLRSRVSISRMCVSTETVTGQRLDTISSSVEVNHVANADVDHSQEALILLLEFLLVKDLDGEDAVFRRFPANASEIGATLSEWIAHVKNLIPVGVQGLLDHRCCSGLFSANGRYSEGIRETCRPRQPLAFSSS